MPVHIDTAASRHCCLYMLVLLLLLLLATLLLVLLLTLLAYMRLLHVLCPMLTRVLCHRTSSHRLPACEPRHITPTATSYIKGTKDTTRIVHHLLLLLALMLALLLLVLLVLLVLLLPDLGKQRCLNLLYAVRQNRRWCEEAPAFKCMGVCCWALLQG
jgi:hypothetical protein